MIDNREQPAVQLHTGTSVKPSSAVVWLSWLIAGLALIAAGAGLFWQNGGDHFTFTTLRGQAVEMYGRGLYRYDTLFTAGTFKGTDAVTIFVGIPLLVFAVLRYRRGSLRGALLLTGVLTYFLYNAISMAFGAAYNSLFLVYAALFSASLFAFVLAFTSVDRQALAARISPRLPHRGIATFLIAAGLVTALVWLSEIIVPLVQGQPPTMLASYTTMVTHAFDTAVITPVVVLAGLLLLRRTGMGYLLAVTMLVLNTLVGFMVVAQTITQLLMGVELSTGQFIGIVGSFVLMSSIATWLTIIFFRNISEETTQYATPLRAAHA